MSGQGPQAPVLDVNWVFGFSKDVVQSVHSLTQRDRNALFFLSSHSGVIYDFEHRTQVVLQGHCNLITCCAVSSDKRWIVTGDCGDDSILVVWDSLTGMPVKTIFSPHPKGVVAVDISEDALYIATLGEADADHPQELAIWAWTRDDDAALLRRSVLVDDIQHTVKFDPMKASEIVTTGGKSVCFWNWAEFSLEGYVGKISKSDLTRIAGKLTSTIFLPGTANAITTTQSGAAILWETQFATVLVEARNERQMRTISKIISLSEAGIRFATTTQNGYLVIACTDGAVRFFDFYLRLEAWFEDLSAGPVTSISFAVQSCPYPSADAGVPGLKFWVPDFIVGTSDAFIVGVESMLFDEIRPDDRRGTLLMQGMSDAISCVACHPSRSVVTLACNNGTLQMWDFEMKLLMNLREFNARVDPADKVKAGSAAAARLEARSYLRPQYTAFEPNGEFLAVCFTSGHLKFISVDSFEDLASFVPSTDAILYLKFSPSCIFLAGYDNGNHVLLFKKASAMDPATSGGETGEYFVYLGRSLSHGGPISGLEFGMRDGKETLVSVGQDRRCVEYDLEVSSVIDGLMVCDNGQAPLLDCTALPTALMWHPHTEDDTEDKFIVATDEFKMKEYNIESKLCRKTSLGPTFGTPPTCMIPLPLRTEESAGLPTSSKNFFAYSTKSKVIGVGALPLTGNPSTVMGLVAHPGMITSIAATFDGKYLFSAGGSDLSVNMWSVDTSALSEASLHPRDMSPYLALLEGGEGGTLHSEIIDYFYYCQLRTQGEHAMETRAVVGTIPVEEIPALARAVGYYPSEEETTNMMNEIRYKTFMVSGKLQTSLDKDEFIKLYLNHRPVLPLNNNQITSAFEVICNAAGVGGAEVRWSKLRELLVAEGEAIAPADMDVYMTSLLGANAKSLLGEHTFDPSSFAEEILGFSE